jgi:hypothetical protein
MMGRAPPRPPKRGRVRARPPPSHCPKLCAALRLACAHMRAAADSGARIRPSRPAPPLHAQAPPESGTLPPGHSAARRAARRAAAPADHRSPAHFTPAAARPAPGALLPARGRAAAHLRARSAPSAGAAPALGERRLL